MEYEFFDDACIVEQDLAMVKTRKGEMTNGICLTVQVGSHCVDIVLEREQLQAALKVVEEDWDGMNAIGVVGRRDDEFVGDFK